jgi:NAD(P)-dependent dehydrogenase (short-subunit alcohol dehydrogenase family)
MIASKAIVITGSSSGIGEACALHLDRAGFRVFAGVRKEADGVALERRASDRLRSIRLDVTDGASIAAAVETVAEVVGDAGVGGVVNNAAIVAAGPLEFLPLVDLREVLEVNVVGQLAVTQAFLPLVRQAAGRLVYVSSTSGRVAAPLTGSYSASKFALEALSDVLRMELRSTGVRVAVIEPGVVATPIWNKNLDSSRRVFASMPEEAQARYGRMTEAVRRWAEHGSERGIPLEDVTGAVLHALVAQRPKARYAVGRGSRLYMRSRVLPDRLRDRILLGSLGAPT